MHTVVLLQAWECLRNIIIAFSQIEELYSFAITFPEMLRPDN